MANQMVDVKHNDRFHSASIYLMKDDKCVYFYHLFDVVVHRMDDETIELCQYGHNIGNITMLEDVIKYSTKPFERTGNTRLTMHVNL